MDVFRVLGNENRRSMLKILMHKTMHISALAKELDISVPVALKHVKTLEGAGFVNRSRLGNTHVVKVSQAAISKIRSAYGLFEEPLVVEVKRGTSLVEALKRVASLGIKSSPEGAFISSIDGKKGYYIYEINGKFCEAPVDLFLVNKDIEVEFKRLMPVVGKKIIIRTKS